MTTNALLEIIASDQEIDWREAFVALAREAGPARTNRALMSLSSPAERGWKRRVDASEFRGEVTDDMASYILGFFPDRKVAAIKALRDDKGYGLKHAKELVEVVWGQKR